MRSAIVLLVVMAHHTLYYLDPQKTPASQKGEPMRKNMTRVIEEVLSADEKIVYIGEDVEHGG